MESTLPATAFVAFVIAQYAAVIAVHAHAHSDLLLGARLPVATNFDDLPENGDRPCLRKESLAGHSQLSLPAR